MRLSHTIASLLISTAAAETHVVLSLGSSYAHGTNGVTPFGQILSTLLGKYDNKTTRYDPGAVSGSVLANISTQGASTMKSDTSIVVISGGGNDVGYVDQLGKNISTGSMVNETEYRRRFVAALNATRDNLVTKRVGCPTCVPIYVVTYPQALGADTVCAEQKDTSKRTSCDLGLPAKTAIAAEWTNFTSWTVSAIGDFKAVNPTYKNVRVLDISSYSKAHDVGSTTTSGGDFKGPWVNGNKDSTVGNGAAWHPNQVGTRWIASQVMADLKQNPTKAPFPPY